MTSSHLRPCPACARHVRVNEAGCPFCGTSLAGVFAGDRAAVSPTARLSRAALFAIGTGTAAVGGAVFTEACDDASTIADYGAAPFDGSIEWFDSGSDAGAPNDAAASSDGGDADAGAKAAGDASEPDDGGSSPDH